jgi:phospholipid/cholesterol/gamma-HCH transport system ATP-binding protein
MQHLIALEEVQLILGGYQALRNVTVGFPEGGSTVIMGPSGCGKSTLLKVAAGLIPPDSGRVLFRGEDIAWFSDRKMTEMRKRNGFVFQDGALWENKTIFDNLALPIQVHFPKVDREEVEHRVNQALERGGLLDSAPQRPAQLSGGERKIASFLRALILEPKWVFLDEPTMSVDHEAAARMQEMIRELKARACTIIAVTHDPQLTSLIADHLVVLDAGAILASGPFDTVKTDADPRVRAILSRVLGEAAAYDSDLLSLLGGGAQDEG